MMYYVIVGFYYLWYLHVKDIMLLLLLCLCLVLYRCTIVLHLQHLDFKILEI